MGFILFGLAVMIACRSPNARAPLPDLAALSITIVTPLIMNTGIWEPFSG